jgi:HEXXH motif-containing protein
MNSGDLFEMLSWRAAADSIASLDNLYFISATNELTSCFAFLNECKAGSATLAALQELPEEALHRLLSAPETYCVAVTRGMRSPGAIKVFLDDAVLAEKARSLDKVLAPNGHWTALGDCCIDHYPPRQWRDVVSQKGEHRFESPALNDTIHIDLACATRPFAPWGNKESLIHLSAPELKRSIARLDFVMEEIGSFCPNASIAVETFTRSIILRKDTENTRSLFSASSNAAVGRTLLVNPHSAQVDTGELAEAVVHEAIHSVLSIFEFEHPLFFADKYDPLVKISSPWTGANLHPHAFLHACFVWYGLMQLWKQARNSIQVDSRWVDNRLRYISDGFSKGTLTDRLRSCRSSVNTEIFHLLDELQDSLLGADLR